ERPVSRWLDEKTTTAFRTRAAWLEEEARAIADSNDQARALLTVSELVALVGETERAAAIAAEARDLSPGLALAWRQARQLADTDEHGFVAALDAEAQSGSPTPAARAHATLLAADVVRIGGEGDGAVERWVRASKLDPADVRGPAARAALAIAQEDYSRAGAFLADNSELVSLGRAVHTALRLRGVERASIGDHDTSVTPVNDAIRRARAALEAHDAVKAAQAIGELATDPALGKAAQWLSATLGAMHIAGRRGSAKALKALAAEGDSLAARQLAARGVELADPELVTSALAAKDESAFDDAERAVLLTLAGHDAAAPIDRLAAAATHAALVDALSAGTTGDSRTARVAGRQATRALTGLGRVLAGKPDVETLDEALASVPSPRPATAVGVALEAAVRAKRWEEVSSALAQLPSGDDHEAAAQRHVAAALVAERAGDKTKSRQAWSEALALGATHDAVVRAAAKLDRDIDLASWLVKVADAMTDGPAAAILRLEALARNADMTDDEQAELLERVHRSAPTLGIGAFLAERIGRRKGDLDVVLHWLQERRSYLSDPIETALDAVREALLVADRDPELASTRLEEAHRARPDDVALRELYERLATEPPADRAAWREGRASKAEGPTAALLWVEAALEHERGGNAEAALAAGKKAIDRGDKGLARLVVDRAELATGNTVAQTEELIARAKETDDVAIRREAYERLADLDAYGKKDKGSALSWHRAILDEAPHHKASLRFIENALIDDKRDDDLDRVADAIAVALDQAGGGEITAHAQLAARLKSREGGWDRTRDMARLGATQEEPSLWALRLHNAHARILKDDDALLATTTELLERTQRPAERAALLLRASEAAARKDDITAARTFLEQAAAEDPGDVVTWGFLAEVRERAGEARAAAEACESLARTSVVVEHQLLAWNDASRIWLDEAKDPERAMSALEQAAEIDVTYGEVFTRLSACYAEKHLDAELARLLERRLEKAEDPDERVTLEVELARALAEMGELAKAKERLQSALDERPSHTTALAAMADLCAKEGDWETAEHSYVRLARLLATPDDQRAIYEKLGEIYAAHLGNFSRAEVAYREVLKRAPKHVATLEKLVDVYKRSNDVGRAVDTQLELVNEASDPNQRLERLIALGAIHETVGRDLRKAEQVLESARKEFPTSVVALRALADFYKRQHQMPAMQILLDRAAGDARRSFAAGRFVTSLFEVLHAAYELRGKKDSARVVAATLAAVEGHKTELIGAETRAVDPRLDDVLAPDVISPALRAMLAHAGDALDVASPLDLRQLKASPLQPGTPVGASVGAVATVVGLGAMQILVSPQLGPVAIPLSSSPATLLVGEGLLKVKNDRARHFVVVRAMKMILTRSSALLRGASDDVSALVAALFTAFNPSFVPQGVESKRVQDLTRRILPALPRNLDPTVGVIALEAAGTLGTHGSQIAAAASAWANRVALLAVGDPSAALDAIAWSKGDEGAPTGAEERAAWIARTAEARELMTFSVTDGYSEARARLGLDK
ncbi:MAG TPA: hypothetical protein VIF62_12245, partial [Labilithrix sp.]